MRGRPSLRSRLIGALVGVALFTVALVGVVSYLFLGDYVLDQQEKVLQDEVRATVDQIEAMSHLMPGLMMRNQMVAALLRSRLRALPEGAGLVVFAGEQVVARAGLVPLREGPLARLRKLAEQRATGESSSGRSQAELDDIAGTVAVLFASAPVELADGSQGLALLTLPRSEALALRSGVLKVLAISGALAAVVAALVGWGLATWLARPLRDLAASARRLADGRYDEEISGRYPGEVQEVAESLEHSRAEIKRSQDSLRAFVATAAHELRTPLTSIQGFSQALLDGTAADLEVRQRAAAAIHKEAVRLQRLIDALLTLSRYDSREFRPRLAPVAVDVLLQEEAARLVQAGCAAPDRVRIQAEKDLALLSDSDMLRQAVANLLRNAVQYGEEGPVGVTAQRVGDQVSIEVWNQGPPPVGEERKRIFERFYRGASARQEEGLGLGLALTREICSLLGGSVELVDSACETRFRILLPLVPRRPETSGAVPRGTA